MFHSMMPTPAPIPQFTSHSGQVCSTWGNDHYKTFNGDIYYFPGKCNYLFASHCKSNTEDFNIQLRRSVENGILVVSHITATLLGVVVEITNKSITLDGVTVTDIPAEKARVHVNKLGNNMKITASTDITLIWNGNDSLLLKLNPNKYANKTCGLCGDFSGSPGFTLDGEQLTPVQYGNLQKWNGPTEECLDVHYTPLHCKDEGEICKSILTSEAFSSCNSILSPMDYIDACVQDLCFCNSENNMHCKCSVFAEYSRQCTHAGGVPGNWRTPDMCPQSCPLNMVYQECGSPCPNTCSNTERTMVCEDHGTDGCFCPPGTVLDDINNTGCIPQEQCPCVYNSETYTPGSSFNTPCRECTCSKGKWKCKELPCTGSCSVEGGSHITSFDGSRYSIKGDCSYVFAKHNTGNDFSVLAEMRRCGITSKKSCLKSVVLAVNKGETMFIIKENGGMFLNWIPTQVPISFANMSIYWATSFYLNIHIGSDFVMQVQLTPAMQIYITLGPSYHGQTCGLCGNFNNIQSDDFKAISGVSEGTAASFANTWKSNSNCPNIKSSYEDPCSLNLEKEKYAQHWCGLLTLANGPFSPCHNIENPLTYHANCLSDTCSCKDSEECMCATLASYAYACAKKGVTLFRWRDNVCEKYTKSCKDSQVYQYNVTQCQPTCRSQSNDGTIFNFKFSPVDGCVCREGTYLNDNGDCVTSSSCPCYYQGNVMESGEMVEENGVKCTCERGQLTCMGAIIKAPVCLYPLVYLNCSSAPKGAKGMECQKSCHTLDMDCFSSQCMSGCVCPPGLVSDEKGGCISEQQCPCIHNEATYRPGDIISVGCNTCTCKNRRWQCTHKPCLGTCSVYGDGHYITFDNKQFTFSGSCEYILVQDNCGENGGRGSFKVITENVPCGTTGTTCTKNIKFFLGGEELRLDNEKIDVVRRDENNAIPYDVMRRGMYMIIKGGNGIYVMWDKKTTIHMKLAPHFQGKVCGICGNYDGNANNDFTTRSHSVVENLMEFGNSWKTDPNCPDVHVVQDPCSKNPYRKAWALKQCAIITSDVFQSCHAQVDPSRYYESCISDSCACDTGGDCECFCTTVALYAQACGENGICINWRTPTICPMFCDYYNDVGECEWHYKACGDKCMKTCRNPKGECLHELSGCEGCYPKCPPSRPFLNENTMKCVAHCGCYENGIYYNNGDKVPRNCSSCVCAEDEIKCHDDNKACQCTFKGKEYNYNDTIPYSEKGDDKCSEMKCAAGGVVVEISKCNVPTEPTAPTDFLKLYTTEKTTIHLPTDKFTSIKKISFESTHRTSTTSPSITTIGKHKGTSTSTELTPLINPTMTLHPSATSSNTPKPLTKETTSLKTTTGHSRTTSAENTISSNPTLNPSTHEPCYWTEWIDVNHPTSDYNGGDEESFEIAKANGISVCQDKNDIRHVKCRVKAYPNIPFEKISQIATCNAEKGLLCNNQDNTGTNNKCHNYEIAFCCGKGLSTTTKMPPSIQRSTKSSITPKDSTKETTVLTTTTGHSQTTSTKLIPSSNPTTTHSPTYEPCYWTEWIDVNFPTPDYNGGDEESFEIAKANGISVCQDKNDIRHVKCRITEHPNIPFENISQIAICNAEKGLLCKNQDNTGTNNMCHNYEIAFCCGKGLSTTTTKTSPSIHRRTTSRVTSKNSTTETTLLTTTTGHSQTTATKLIPSSNPTMTHSPTYEPCYWTEWIDVNHPTSDYNGGDEETFEIAKSNERNVCKDKKYIKDIECKASSYPQLNISDLHQNITCNIEKGLICRNQDNPGPNSMCLNYKMKLYCCELVFETKTTRIPPSTLLNTTSSITSKDSTTETTLLTTTTGHSQTTSTKLIPSSNQTTTHSPTYEPCYWTEWIDVNQPTSDYNGGDEESFEIAKANGISVCQDKNDIRHVKCRIKAYPNIPFEKNSQIATCNAEKGLLCKNQDNTGTNNMCHNYEIAFCCGKGLPTTTTKTSPSIHRRTTSRVTSKNSTTETTLLRTTTGHSQTTSTKLIPSSNPTTTHSPTYEPCYWTEWIDVNFPTPDYNGGDEESFEIAKANGISVCQDKNDIRHVKCRITEHPNIPFENISQIAICNAEKGLLCKNQDNTGTNNMCHNYEIAFCCGKGLSTTTTKTSPSIHRRTTSRVTSKNSTTETTLLTTTTGHSQTTATKLIPSSNPTMTHSPTYEPCYWTEWIDVNHPTSDYNGGDEETFERAKSNERNVCKDKKYIKDIECKASSYPQLNISDLHQNITCNIEKGLICRNQDNPGPNSMCLNYKMKLYCCELVFETKTTRIPPSTLLNTTSSITSKDSTTETTLLTTTTGHSQTTSTKLIPSSNQTTTHSPTYEPCYWTEWIDVNQPTSDYNGGDEESFEIAKANGISVCQDKNDIRHVKCRIKAYPNIPFEKNSQIATCNAEKGLLCKNQDNTGTNNMCHNYEIAFCCGKGLPTTTTKTSPSIHRRTTSRVTSKNSTTETPLLRTSTGYSQTIATKLIPSSNPTTMHSPTYEPCYWTEWIDVNFPTPDYNGGDEESFEIAKANGISVCQDKNDIRHVKCRITEHPNIPFENISQIAICNAEKGLLCKNQDNTGTNNMCHNYEIAFCCGKGLSTTTTKTSPSIHRRTTSRVTSKNSTTETTLLTTTTGHSQTTATKLIPSSNPTMTHSPTYEPCYWTEWIDVNHPMSDSNGGDEETFEIAKSNERNVCKDKKYIKDIECKASSYPQLNISDLHQNITCNIEKGLICRNQDNPGPNSMCLNYKMKLYCCELIFETKTTRIPPSTLLNTTSSITSKDSTTETTLLTTTTGHSQTTSTKLIQSSNQTTTHSPTYEPCHWTEWIDVNQPTSDYNGGDEESFEIAKANGISVCQDKNDIRHVKCRIKAYPNIPFEKNSQIATCNAEKGLLCKNQDNTGTNNMCHNYEIAFCCGKGLPTTTTKTSPSIHRRTTSRVTSKNSTTETPLLRTSTGYSQTIATKLIPSSNPTTMHSPTYEPCYWTEWIDVNFPTPDYNGGDEESFEIAKANGISVCQDKNDIRHVKCRITEHPNIPFENISQIAICNAEKGLLCKNQDNTGTNNMCHNYEIAFCCGKGLSTITTTMSPSIHRSTTFSFTRTDSTTETTLLRTTTGHSQTTSTKLITSSNPTTTYSSTYEPCYWTEWIDVNHPASDSNGGDEESFEIAKANGISVCQDKNDIRHVKCRIKAYPNIPFEKISQIATCNAEKGLLCKNQDNTGTNNMCHNYEIAFCCGKGLSTTTTKTSPSIHWSTTSSITPKDSRTEITLLRTTTGLSQTTSTKLIPSSNPTTTHSPTYEPCYWTEWIDVNHPTSDSNGGDEESFEIAKVNGISVCQDKNDIRHVKCRIKAYPNIPFEKISQIATCNAEKGLLCKNQDNTGTNNMCHNYEIAFCCGKGLSTTTTKTSPSVHRRTTSKVTSKNSTTETPLLTTTTGHSQTTATKLIPSSNPTTMHSPTYEPCYWTEWIDVNFPTPDYNGGDEESFEIAKANGISVCQDKNDIRHVKCRITEHPNIPFENISQIAICNAEKGLLCKNQDNTGTHNMCHNYEIAFCCGKGLSTITTTTSPSIHRSTTSSFNRKDSTTEATLLRTTTGHSQTTSTKLITSSNPTTTYSSTYEPCYWTEWIDVNHPTSDSNGGDEESFEIAKANGISVCQDKNDIRHVKCRIKAHPNVPFENISQIAICNAEKGLLCKNQDNTGTNDMCHNYEIAFCCGKGLSTTTTKTSQSIHQSTTFNITPKDYTTETTLRTTGHSQTTSTKLITSSNPTTTHSSTYEPCYWTEWIDVNHPTSDYNGGDEESFEIAKANGISVCQDKNDIRHVKCRIKAYPNIPFEKNSQIATCNTEKGLLCKNQDNTGTNNMCHNYEIAFCCGKGLSTTTTKTSPSIYQSTTSSITPKDSTKETTLLTTTTGRSQTIATKLIPSSNPTTTTTTTTDLSMYETCYWTEWIDVNHPTSDYNGGDEETFIIAKSNGRNVCKDKESIKDIECKASSYPQLNITDLNQNITCNIEKGLICRNQDNRGPQSMCLNYKMKLKCCNAVTSPSTRLTRTSSHTSSPSTIEKTSSSTIESSSLTGPKSPTMARPPFCVYEGSEYEVGTSVPKNPKSCEECKCTMENYSAKVTCKRKVCQTRCPLGFIYKPKPGECCGKCVQTFCQLDASEMIKGYSDENLPEKCCQNCSQDVCAINNTVLIKPGNLWRPPGDNCTCYDCEPKKFTVIRREMSCPVQKPLKCEQGILVNFTSADGCCTIQSCEPRKCDVMKSWKVIESEECEANVTITNCGGYCTSISRHPSFPKMVEHDCTCCQPTKTTSKKVHLLCKNGRKISYSYTDILQCGCRGAACVFTE
ncbi:mucin-5AC-like [Hyla sarda]|uniref:mucin-5AC-like n=1 Tax=Hyla sarda TaxID=327740 RepID=UPI0024C2F119|nr:mucin-5AC-like [Hyla sarda]